MSSAENAILYYESGQDPTEFAALIDSGDHRYFKSKAELWSRRGGFEPDIKPNGLATGGIVTPAISGEDNKIDVAALSCYLFGQKCLIAASLNLPCTRPTSPNTHVVNSVTVNSSKEISILAGTSGLSFSEIRGTAGGAPFIPITSIEIAQVRLSSSANAPVFASEIKSQPNIHTEWYHFPTWQIKCLVVEKRIIGNAGIIFDTPLPLVHVGGQPKPVFAKYNEPVFSEIRKASDFKPSETTHSISSKQIYGMSVGNKSSSLGQGSFNALLDDGISDNLLELKNENLWFKFKPNRLADPYILMQGYLGISRTFPAGDSISAACTISSEQAAIEVII
ncbi:MAG: hypothetical protein HQK78_03300 [Desulfobacterales bacterium]|nr:hypothetical protein [Desulfobacterales bacterium]